MKKTDPTSFDCRTCGTNYKFGLYVFAHWQNQLKHECKICGEVTTLQAGVTRVSRPGNKRRADNFRKAANSFNKVQKANGAVHATEAPGLQP